MVATTVFVATLIFATESVVSLETHRKVPSKIPFHGPGVGMLAAGTAAQLIADDGALAALVPAALVAVTVNV